MMKVVFYRLSAWAMRVLSARVTTSKSLFLAVLLSTVLFPLMATSQAPGSNLLPSGVHLTLHIGTGADRVGSTNLQARTSSRSLEQAFLSWDHLQELCGALAQASSVNLRVSPQAVDAIEGIPLLGTFLDLLLQGSLGFRITHASFDIPQRTAGGHAMALSFSDIPPDAESTMAFVRVARLTATDIAVRIVHPLPFANSSSLSASPRLLDSALGPSAWSQVWQATLWSLCFVILACLGAPAIGALFGPLSAGWSYTLSPLLFSLLLFNLQKFEVLALSSPAIFFCFLLYLGGCGLLSTRISNAYSSLRACLKAGAIFLPALFLFLTVRAFQPEIHWGEKPMDFTFLNFFIRSPALPPQDPWASGNPMNYYYFGFYAFGQFIRALDIYPAVGYNLAVATVGATLITALVSSFRLFGVSAYAALLAAVSISALSSVEWIRLVFVEGKGVDFDTFWATSRVLSSPAITEYPLWSQLFADLHPHVMAQPLFVVLVSALLICFFCLGDLTPRRSLMIGGGFGVFAGILFRMNAWDAISLAFVGLIALVVAVCGRLPKQSSLIPPQQEGRWLKAAACFVAAGITTGLLSVVPDALSSEGTSRVGWGWVTGREFNDIKPVLRHLGLWIVPALCALLPFMSLTWLRLDLRTFLISAGVGLTPLVIAYLSEWRGSEGLVWRLYVGFSLGAALCTFSLIRSQKTIGRLAAISCLTAILIMTLSETFYLMDRMNTIFKFYQAVWILWGVGTCLALWAAFQQTGASELRPLRWPIFGVAGVTVILGALGTLLGLVAMLSLQRVEGPRPTLNGIAYLTTTNRDEALLVDWINRNIRGTPTIVEAWGPSYQDYGRISMLTGLPSVLGWEYHVQQRGTSGLDVHQRKELVKSLYTNPSDPSALRNAIGIGARYLVVSELERRTYQLEEFPGLPGTSHLGLTLVKEFGNARLFEFVAPPQETTTGFLDKG